MKYFAKKRSVLLVLVVFFTNLAINNFRILNDQAGSSKPFSYGLLIWTIIFVALSAFSLGMFVSLEYYMGEDKKKHDQY